LVMLNNLGDGSTLSLDFTSGVLDPRFTFTRSTTATFINSSGYVVYADHNLVQNSTMLVSTSWTPNTSGGGTVTINNNNTVTFASTAGRATWLQGITIQSGLPVTFSLEVTALTNTNMRVSDLFQAGTGFTSQVYNYTDLSGNTTTNIGAFTTLPGVGLYTVNATTSATSGNVVFGTDCNGVTRTGSVTIARPQLQYGTFVSSRVYLANSSTSAANTNTPRFDYDPTTLTPRGLLIEGSATNLLKYSAYADTNWLAYGSYTKSYTTGITSPANDTTAARITFSAVGNGLFTNNTQMAYTNTVGATYTFSAWIRATSNTTNLNIRFGDSAVANGPNIPISTSWVRYSYSYVAVSASGPSIQSASGTATGEFEMWGFQLETGSSASSYIPTGASQGARAADSCVLSGTNFSSWFNATQGTLLTAWSGTGTTSGRYATINDGSASNQIWTGYSESAIYNGSFQASFAAALTSNGKVAIAYATNDAAWCLNNGSVATDTNVTLPTGLNQIAIGNSQAGTAAINTSLRSIKYFPSRLPNATLQSLTA
jgi:hypothetical protein